MIETVFYANISIKNNKGDTMEKIQTVIKAGIEKPFSLLLIADTHLTFSDKRDSEEIKQLSEKRSITYTHGYNLLEASGKLSDETGAILIIEGDMIDFQSAPNLEYVTDYTKKHKVFYIAGNHDFRPMGGMKYDVPESLEKGYGHLQNAFENNILCSSKIINGVNIVGLFNAYYRLSEEHFEFLKKQISLGLPILLMLHVPLYHPDLYNLIRTPKRFHASQMAVPEKMMTDYPPERFTQQIADDITRQAYEYIINEPLIKAVFSGHLHKNSEVIYSSGLIQYITGKDTIRLVSVE